MQIDDLVQAMQTINAADAFKARLNIEQWRSVAPYLSRHELRIGDVLIKQGEADRTVYLLAQGTLQVIATGAAPGSSRIAILRSGSVVGEQGLFSDMARMASVEAMTACVVFALRGARFEELAQRLPNLAFELLRAAGGVMATRMRENLTRQVPFS